MWLTVERLSGHVRLGTVRDSSWRIEIRLRKDDPLPIQGLQDPHRTLKDPQGPSQEVKPLAHLNISLKPGLLTQPEQAGCGLMSHEGEFEKHLSFLPSLPHSTEVQHLPEYPCVLCWDVQKEPQTSWLSFVRTSRCPTFNLDFRRRDT